MRDYAELVNGLRDCSRRNARVCMICGAKASNLCEGTKSKRMFYAADAIEELLARDVVPTDFHERCLQLEIRKRIELEKQMPHWISVEERLPEESGYTIVFCADGARRHVTFAKYQKTPKRWELTGARSYWRVLRWMSLPEPPKEDADNG